MGGAFGGHRTDQLLAGSGLGVPELSAGPGLCLEGRPLGPAPEGLAEQVLGWSPR